MGLEGLVSKWRDRPYQAGRVKAWVRVKKAEAPSDGKGHTVVSVNSMVRIAGLKAGPGLGTAESRRIMLACRPRPRSPETYGPRSPPCWGRSSWIYRPLPTVGRFNLHAHLCVAFHPAAKNAPAGKYERMRPVVIDDGYFQVSVKRRSFNFQPRYNTQHDVDRCQNPSWNYSAAFLFCQKALTSIRKLAHFNAALRNLSLASSC
jgi:hypothetical protein